MPDWSRLRGEESGVTNVELMVVIVIISIVAAMALMGWGGSRERFRLQNVANELKVAFERARFDSVKRRPEDSDSFSRVVIAGTSTIADHYTLTTDLNQNGAFDTSDDVVTNTTAHGVAIRPYPGVSMTFPVTVAFNMRGESVATQSDGSAVLPSFIACFNPCTPANSLVILVTPTGTVNLLQGTAGIPGFTAPGGMSDVPGDTDVNDLVTVDGEAPTPVPTATPDPNGSPTPDPTGSPTPDPTGTPTPDPTGTPTPDPTGTPTPAPTGTPTPGPTGTPTPTPIPPCSLTANSSYTFLKNGGSQTINLGFSNAINNVLTFSVTGIVTSAVKNPPGNLSGSGAFDLNVNYGNGANKSGTLTIHGCGSDTLINIKTTS